MFLKDFDVSNVSPQFDLNKLHCQALMNVLVQSMLNVSLQVDNNPRSLSDSLTYSERNQPLISLEVAFAVEEPFWNKLVVVLPMVRIVHYVN